MKNNDKMVKIFEFLDPQTIQIRGTNIGHVRIGVASSGEDNSFVHGEIYGEELISASFWGVDSKSDVEGLFWKLQDVFKNTRFCREVDDM